jgi:hypothetical protein
MAPKHTTRECLRVAGDAGGRAQPVESLIYGTDFNGYTCGANNEKPTAKDLSTKKCAPGAVSVPCSGGRRAPGRRERARVPPARPPA